MRRPSVVVFGASGLVGSAVTRALRVEYQVLTAGRGLRDDIACDLAAPRDDLAGQLAGIDAAVHCAGVTDEEIARDPSAAWRRATHASAALADHLRAAGIRRLAYVSSAHVYGPLEGTLSEASPPDPRSDVALAHFATEQIFRRAGFVGAALRPCAVYGVPRELARFARWSLIPFAFARMAVEAGCIALGGSGLQRRNFVAAEEVGECARAAIARDYGFVVVNPVGHDELSLAAFAERIASGYRALTGRGCAVEPPHGEAPGAPLRYCSLRGGRRVLGDLDRTMRAVMSDLIAARAG